jgi:hypothetical protein
MGERAWPSWLAPGARAPLPAPRDGPPPGHPVPDSIDEDHAWREKVGDRRGEGGGAGWARKAQIPSGFRYVHAVWA